MKSKKADGFAGHVSNFLMAVTAQVKAYEKRERSRVEQEYGIAMSRSATALLEFTRYASFDELIEAENTLQKNDLIVYAQRPATTKAVQEGMDDFDAGMEVCQQLLHDTAAYKAHSYRKKERLPPEKIIPLDAMRRALRGQVKRVENYRANVMGNAQEQEFMSARIALLRRAEELYDEIQRERLLQA